MISSGKEYSFFNNKSLFIVFFKNDKTLKFLFSNILSFSKKENLSITISENLYNPCINWKSNLEINSIRINLPFK